jgi:hypothetical protein
VTRREVLKGLAALATSGWIPPALAQGALAPPQFKALSDALAGYAYSDPAIASALLRALTQVVGRSTLARLAKIAANTPAPQLDAAISAAGLAAAAEAVVIALYTGTVETTRGPRVVSYDQALVWQALPWTKPNAFCGGETNYWASAPSPSS